MGHKFVYRSCKPTKRSAIILTLFICLFLSSISVYGMALILAEAISSEKLYQTPTGSKKNVLAATFNGPSQNRTRKPIIRTTGREGDADRVFGEYDLVYTWVNGSDPDFQEVLRQHAGGIGGRMGAYRDYDTLKYSLRSAERFFPKFRHIYIVTNGQIPTWLDLEQPDVSIVTHEQIYAYPEDLPTFSSHSIETHLHRIPGLNTRFMYCNDDMMFGRKLKPEDLWEEPDEITIYFSTGKIPANKDIASVRNIWRKACMHSNDVLNNDPDIEYKEQRYHAAHHCYNMNKQIIREMELRYEDEFRRTSSHKFRRPNDIDIPFFVTNFIPYSGWKSKAKVTDFMYMKVENNPAKLKKTTERMLKRKPKFLCFNDGWGNGPTDECFDIMANFFEKLLPGKSRFEL